MLHGLMPWDIGILPMLQGFKPWDIGMLGMLDMLQGFMLWAIGMLPMLQGDIMVDPCIQFPAPGMLDGDQGVCPLLLPPGRFF